MGKIKEINRTINVVPRVVQPKMGAKNAAFPTQAQALKKKVVPEERGYELLEFLEDNEGLSVNQISKKLNWDSNLVNYCVSMLENKGLVRIREEIENNELQEKIYVNKEVGIREMLNMAEIDPRVLKDFNV
ncbi:MAG: winged helix-turn-helix domain-containing protein [archaeon]|nr:winged helix-turn-helix domain-containing protein [archaeon]